MSAAKESAPAPAAATKAPASAANPNDDLTVFIQNLLTQMQGKFEQMSDNILGKIDEMGTRINDLEKSVSDLMAQAGVPQDAAAPAATKP
eukprot:m51a1_g10069 putative heat shock factor-binding protein 1-like (90) ;mRNA; r:12590-13054